MRSPSDPHRKNSVSTPIGNSEDAYASYIAKRRGAGRDAEVARERSRTPTRLAKSSPLVRSEFHHRHPRIAGILLMTIGVPIAGIIGSLADPIGCGPWMAAASFGYGFALFFRSFGPVGRIIIVATTLALVSLAVIVVISAARR